MKYTKAERLRIGEEIYKNRLSIYEAAEKYGINYATARDYMRMYRDINQLPAKAKGGTELHSGRKKPEEMPEDMETLESMSKEELILEVIKSRLNEARLKKGYMLEGDGVAVFYENENTK